MIAAEPGLVGEGDERGAVAAVELVQDVSDVGLGGEGADHEPARDLGVPQALGDEAVDLALALGQLGERCGRLAGGRGRRRIRRSVGG
jgi:hypothetical protein